MPNPETSAPPLPDGIHEHVESFSLLLERFGFQRMAGRIFALMLLREESLTTQAELAGQLQASTGSISTMIRLLEQLGYVERVSLSGHRRDRFRLKPDPLVDISRRRIEGAINMIDVINKAKLHKGVGERATDRLARAESFYRFYHVEMELALVRWLEANPLTEEPAL